MAELQLTELADCSEPRSTPDDKQSDRYIVNLCQGGDCPAR